MLPATVLLRGGATPPPLPTFVPPPQPVRQIAATPARQPRVVGRVPYGYRHGPHGGLVVVPHEAVLVRTIFHDYLRAPSLSALCRALNAGLYPYSGSRRWTRSSVRRLLQRCAYVGLHRQGSVPGLNVPLWLSVPKIVPAPTYFAATSRLHANAVRMRSLRQLRASRRARTP